MLFAIVAWNLWFVSFLRGMNDARIPETLFDDEPETGGVTLSHIVATQPVAEKASYARQWEQARQTLGVPAGTHLEGVIARAILCPWCAKPSMVFRDEHGGNTEEGWVCECAPIQIDYFDHTLPWYTDRGEVR